MSTSARFKQLQQISWLSCLRDAVYEQLPQILFGHLLTKNHVRLVTHLQTASPHTNKASARVVMAAHGGSVNPAELLENSFGMHLRSCCKTVTPDICQDQQANNRPKTALCKQHQIFLLTYLDFWGIHGWRYAMLKRMIH